MMVCENSKKIHKIYELDLIKCKTTHCLGGNNMNRCRIFLFSYYVYGSRKNSCRIIGYAI